MTFSSQVNPVPFSGNTPDVDIFDLSDWPVVFTRFPELDEENRVERVLTGLDCLLEQKTPYVNVWIPPSHDHDDEPHEDEKASMVWVKGHKDQLNAHCAGYIYIVTDEKLQKLLEGRLKTVSKRLYSFPMKIVKTREEALKVGKTMLGLIK